MRSNYYTLDGASMVNTHGANSASMSNSTLGVDGIREIKVITNSFSAEYGMTMGSQMLLVSKGDPNTFHGSLFEYLRNSALDARNFFDYKSAASQRRLPVFARNNFGGSFGGPIKRDKTYFFGVFEGVKERKGVTIIDNVPAASAKVDGGLVPVIAPVIKPLLTLFPNPNLPNNQYTFPFTQPTSENYGQIRVDQNFSNNDSLFVRYTIDDAHQTLVGGTGLSIGAYPQYVKTAENRQQFGTVSENHVFSPTLLNTFRFSFSRTNYNQADGANEPGGPGISLVPDWPMGTLTIGGITPIGSSGISPFIRLQNIFTYSDDVFYTRGRHSLKFGTLVNHFQHYIGLNTPKGAATFANLAGFLTANATAISQIDPNAALHRTHHYNTFGFYAQDDVRVGARLTLNLGLRYEFTDTPQEQYGQWSAFRDIQHDSSYTISPDLYKNPSLKNFSPRFGFAWNVMGDGKTAIRGGFSELYDIGNIGYLIIQSGSGQPPFTNQVSLTNPPAFTVPLTFPPNVNASAPRPLDWLLKQPHMLQYNLTLERQLPFDMALTLAYAGSRGMNLVHIKEGNPTIPTVLPDGRKFWPVGAPRTNPKLTTLDLFTADSSSWYNGLQFGLMKRLGKGLQFQSSYTWSRTIDENGSYTNTEQAAQNGHCTDCSDRRVDRALTGFDITQVWKFNAIYHLPSVKSSNGIVGKALKGWWISGILDLESGLPYTPALNSDRTRAGVYGTPAGLDRPDLVPGTNPGSISSGSSKGCQGVAAGTPVGTPSFYFDPCAFTIPSAGFLGTAGRNILRGPGFSNLDFSVVKDTALGFLGESGKLQFRAEFFNILNHANFTTPNRIVFAGAQNVEAPLSNAGQIVSTVGTSRQIQLAMKILF